MQESGWRSAIRRAAEMGALVTGTQLTLEKGESLLIEQHRGILEYTEEAVTVAAERFTVRVTGEGLTLISMDGGSLRLRGRIDGVTLLREEQ